MSRIFIKIIIFLTSFLTFGQQVDKIEIIPKGVKGFLVRDFDNKSEAEIYKSIKDWTEYNIKNASFATNSNVNNEFITFKVNNVGIIHFKNKPTWSLNLYVEIRIKPYKARIDIEILEIDGIKENQSSLNIVGANVIMGLYKKNGKPVSGYRQTREEINKILNEFAEQIFQSVNGNKDYKKDDW